MYTFSNSCVIYVSQLNGDDGFSGFSPVDDGQGNGPFKTANQALSVILEARKGGFVRPVTISFTEDYYVCEPIKINDPLLNGITFESYKEKVKIVGGTKLDGWEKDTFNGVKCYCAKIPQKDGKQIEVNDLFVNGKRADVTRYPEKGFFHALDTENNFDTTPPPIFTRSKWFVADKKDLEGVNGIEGATVNYSHYWLDEHSKVESYDEETGKIVMALPSSCTISTIYSPTEHTSGLNYYFTHVPNGFKNNGQWYADAKAGKIYYIPKADEDFENAETIIPACKRFVELSGCEEEKIKNIRFKNLEFFCADISYKEKAADGTSLPKYAAFGQAAQGTSGAISFEHATNCMISDCEIHGTGTYGIVIDLGCADLRIENNKFYDMGAGAVLSRGENSIEKAISHLVIKDNVISHTGVKYAAACGITLCHANNCEISNNEICHTTYSAISVGWIWGYDESASFANKIDSNYIHHIGNGFLSDLGGIYTLGKQPGTVVSNNRIHDIKSAHYGGWGIYLDEGSTSVTVENNVVYNTTTESIHLNYGSFNTVKNNIFVLGQNGAKVTYVEDHDGMAIESNIFVVDGTSIYSGNGAPGSISSRKNIIWDVSNDAPHMYKDNEEKFYSLEDWQALGKDFGTIVCDPLFSSFSEKDFTLSPSSPAIELGLVPLTGFLATGK